MKEARARSIKICFVVPYAYPLFEPSVQHIFGGSEVRAWMLGRGLSQFQEYEVSFILLDHGQLEVEERERVKLYRHSYYKAYPPYPRNFWKKQLASIQIAKAFPFIEYKPLCDSMNWKSSLGILRDTGSKGFERLRSLIRKTLRIEGYRIPPKKVETYQQIDADVYCAFGASDLAAELAAFCGWSGKKFVMFSSNDEDFSELYTPRSLTRNAYGSRGFLCHYAITRANLVVTQSQKQLELLRQRFKRDGAILYSPIDLISRVDREIEGPLSALWVGKSDQVKRPEILLELACQMRQVNFTMVLNRADLGRFREVIGQKPANVQIYERIRFQEMDRLFKEAKVLINTSVFEGFPYTFLQAGKFGVPILSLEVDPDGFIQRYHCGKVAMGNKARLLEGLQELIGNPDLWRTCSKNIRDYVESRHELNSVVKQLDGIFRELMKNAA